MEPAQKEHLQKSWVKLLKNITDINSIIDGLYCEGVLTETMKEQLNARQGRAQLRELLDILPKRGKRAFSVFYKVLVDCEEYVAADILCPDPEVLSVDVGELPSGWPDSEVHDPSKIKVVNVREDDISMRKHFNNATKGTNNVFPLCRPMRGICLLLSNRSFKDARGRGKKFDDLLDRDGTEHDCNALEDLFASLNFVIEKEEDLSAKRMLEAIQRQAAKDHTDYDCFVCAVLSHGERDKVHGTDGELMCLLEFQNALNECPTLIGKPKLFFIQACQTRPEAPPDAAVYQNMEQVSNKMVNLSMSTEHADGMGYKASPKSEFFVAMATIPDDVSWRNTTFGTWFVQAVVYVLSRWSHKYDLLHLMTMVNGLVSKAKTKYGKQQVSIFKSALTKDLYFFPGLPDR